MRSHVFHTVLAIFLVSGTWWASHPGMPPTAKASERQIGKIANVAEVDVLDLRIGDSFWGLHLSSVVPCSKMLVKGGGWLVTLSVRNDGDARCVYHVMDEKLIELQGKRFRLRVVGTDQIHVEREPSVKAVATNP